MSPQTNESKNPDIGPNRVAARVNWYTEDGRPASAPSALGDWLVAISSRTKFACDNAKDAGFTAYAPIYREKIDGEWKDRFMLGRYFLIEIIQEWATQFHKLLKVAGIRGVLHYNEKMPVIVRAAEVRRLRLRENKYGQIDLSKIDRFKLKQRVMITKGAFADKFGSYAGEEDDLEKVELDAFGQIVAMGVPIDSLIAV